jgi:hypothetical protein
MRRALLHRVAVAQAEERDGRAFQMAAAVTITLAGALGFVVVQPLQ